jgi:hypothetical protein
MLTVTALAFLTTVVGGVLNWVYKTAGRLTTQVILFVAALIFALWETYGSNFPNIGTWLGQAVVIFSMAVAAYEVILHYFPAFSGPQS